MDTSFNKWPVCNRYIRKTTYLIDFDDQLTQWDPWDQQQNRNNKKEVHFDKIEKFS